MPRQLDCDAIIPFLSSQMCAHFTFNTPAVAPIMVGMLAKILLRCRKCWVCQHFYNCFPSNSAVSVPSAPFYSCFSLAYLPSFPSVNSYDQKHAHTSFRCFVTSDGYRFSNSVWIEPVVQYIFMNVCAGRAWGRLEFALVYIVETGLCFRQVCFSPPICSTWSQRFEFA